MSTFNSFAEKVNYQLVKLVRFFDHPILIALLFIVLLYNIILFILPTPAFYGGFSTVVCSQDGLPMQACMAPDEQWRYKNSDQIPEKLEKCILTFEDEWHYWHFGVNPISLAKAALGYLKNGKITRGGSTISMQVARLAIRKPNTTLLDKFYQICMALQLEQQYSKAELLQLWMQHAPYGSNRVGVRTASWMFFGHDVQALSWGEAALLAIVPNAPGKFSLRSAAKKKYLQKRNKLLTKLYRKNTINKNTWLTAMAEGWPSSYTIPENKNVHLLQKAKALGLKEQWIVSTVDPTVQNMCIRSATSYIQRWLPNGVNNAAIVVVSTQNGAVKAYVGNAGSNKTTVENQFVNMVEAKRSTGSLLKPWLYALCLEKGIINPEMLLSDVPAVYGNFTPKNNEEHYEGMVKAKNALARSLNQPAVAILNKVGVRSLLDVLQSAGLKSLNKPASHYGLALILGGGEATLWELVNSYSLLGNIGLGHKTATQIHFLPNDVTALSSKNLPQTGAAWLTLKAMEEVVRPDGNPNGLFESVKPIAWKSGTSFGNRDAWAIGITPEYIVGVWLGNASGEGRPGLTGVGAAAPLMFNVFQKLNSKATFPYPSYAIEWKKACAATGYAPIDACNTTKMVPTPKGSPLPIQCPYHIRILTTPDGLYRVNQQCAPGLSITRNCLAFPPLEAYYYKQSHMDYNAIPPWWKGCNSNENLRDNWLWIHPQPNATLTLPALPNSKKGVLLAQIAVPNTTKQLLWYVNGKYTGRTERLHQLRLELEDGNYSIEVIAENGEKTTNTFRIGR